MRPGSALEQRIKQVRGVMPENKKHLPLWNSEGGFWPNEVRDLTPLTSPTLGDGASYWTGAGMTADALAERMGTTLRAGTPTPPSATK